MEGNSEAGDLLGRPVQNNCAFVGARHREHHLGLEVDPNQAACVLLTLSRWPGVVVEGGEVEVDLHHRHLGLTIGSCVVGVSSAPRRHAAFTPALKRHMREVVGCYLLRARWAFWL